MTDTITITDPNTKQTIEYQIAPICGFWRRIFAMVLDGLILAVFGWLLSLIFTAQFVQMGVYGRLIGFVIVLIYFWVFNSRIGKGQSIGKRLLHIKVVNQAGEYIAPALAFCRSIILELPFFLCGVSVTLPPSSVTLFISSLIIVFLFGLALGTLYLYLFNQNSRQAIHDLICKTYVVRESLSGSVYTEPISKIHFVVLSVIIVIGIALPFVFNSRVSGFSTKKIFDIQEKLTKSKNVSNVVVNEGINFSHGKSIGYIEAMVFVKNQVSEEQINSIAQSILSVPEFAKKNYIGVIICYGYNIVIWSYYHRQKHWYTPQEWMERIKK